MSAPAIRDERSAPFFDALRDGRLLLWRCRPHGHISAPEVMFCAECDANDLEWTDAAGTGSIVSWTALHSRPDDAGATTVTAHVGLVELVEGPWLLARLMSHDADQVRTGAAVELQVIDAGEPIYAFRTVD
jgi:uncharacterized OB-fold protein